MSRLRLALAQIDPTVGDLRANVDLIRHWTGQAAGSGADLVVFPEMAIPGYPVEDLVMRASFVEASRSAVPALASALAADGLGDPAVVVGYLDADGPARLTAGAQPERGPRNALAVLHGGRVVATYAKHHLPNYGVFDEDRYFVPGQVLTIARIRGVDVAFAICEDLWQPGGPLAVAGQVGVGLVCVLNGSPYELDKGDARLELVTRRAAEAGATLAYVNLVGAQDELVFDGDSMVVEAGGTVLARAPQFTEYLTVIDLDLPPGDPQARFGDLGWLPDATGLRVERVLVSPPAGTPAPPPGSPAGPPTPPAPVVAPRLCPEEEVWRALVCGLRDYVRKNGFASVILGLSGGIDSAVVAAIACDAVGASSVVGVSMPSEHSSRHSREDAADLARRTGLNYRIEPITTMVETLLAQLPLTGLAVENLQARIRAVILMGLSNEHSHLVLTTGNKSELSVGYSTLYGDSVGGFNPIKDVPKTLVWRLAEWRNAEAERLGAIPPIPKNSISKPPSAELRPGQLDTDSLPDYRLLDAILADYIDGDLGRAELIAAGHDPALVDRVVRLVDLAEFKRRQSAPGTKISVKAFGRDRRLPITNRFREG
ncbi:MAG: NAD+ synthase [Micromonosporaceae bacterium]|nr:NAD+ synthase [Micromonosporaceae bacterium]